MRNLAFPKMCIRDRLLTGRKVGFFTDFLWNGTLPKGLCEEQFCDRNIQITINTDSLKGSSKKRAKKEGYDTETGVEQKEIDRSEMCSEGKAILRLVPPVIILEMCIRDSSSEVCSWQRSNRSCSTYD